MKRAKLISAVILSLFLLSGAGAVLLHGQVVPSAFKPGISLTVGGTASIFNPDYVQNNLEGIGAYADLTLFHGIGVEAEGRWQRIHQYYGISQDNYLFGPRVQLHHIWRLSPYVKGLGGFSNMNFGDYGPFVGTGRFTTFAFGGGVDFHLTRRITIRPVDAEYQIWPEFPDQSLKPYGLSAGASYRIF